MNLAQHLEIFELRRCPLFELSDGLRPARDESWVDPAGEESGEARAELSARRPGARTALTFPPGR